MLILINFKGCHLPGTSSVCRSLRMPRVDFARYVCSSLPSGVPCKPPPKKRFQRGAAACGGVLCRLFRSPMTDGVDSADDSMSDDQKYCMQVSGRKEANWEETLLAKLSYTLHGSSDGTSRQKAHIYLRCQICPGPANRVDQ